MTQPLREVAWLPARAMTVYRCGMWQACHRSDGWSSPHDSRNSPRVSDGAWMMQFISELVAKNRVQTLLPEKGTKPRVYYIV